MLKKAHKSLTENTCSRNDSKPCSVCKSCSTKTVLYVCESGHVICAHCQTDDDAKDIIKDHGDCSNKGQTNCKRNEIVHHILKQHKSDHIHKSTEDLASGDCDKSVKTTTTKLKGKSKSEHKNITVDDDNNKNKVKDNNADNIEAIVKYKNVNFKNNKSSDSDLLTPPSEVDLAESNQDAEETLTSEVCPRPVVCPVLDCGKTIAMNSAMLHFYYDHPKVPRLLLTKGTHQDTVLKVADISMKTQCLNIFLLPDNEGCGKIDKKVSSNDILRANFTPLLLMSARMVTKGFKSEYNKKRYMVQETIKNEVNKVITDTKSKIFNENEMLLLWICKLEEPLIRYSITLISKDKKHGHSYIGESVHIRKDQDALAIFQRADSLVIHGPALKKILDCEQLSVILNILD